MELNEIKKALYRQKPNALLNRIYLNVMYYDAVIDEGTDIARDVHFEVPVNDIGNATFEVQMDAKLLIRWLVV